jgi:transcriptional regulator GlxA family with amidase domain
MDGRIFHIKQKLEHSLGHDWTVEQMAEAVRLSVPRFKQLFKQEMGISPMAYLLELRLERAREMIRDTHSFLQIKEIGAKCGLKNDSHFTKYFKKRYGMTPTETRNKIWEIEQSAQPDEQK